jgi:hypothetical protein
MNCNWGESYYQHFEKFFGEPTTRFVFSQEFNAPSIQILGYENVFSKCRVFCSLGLSHYVGFVQSVGEIFVPCDAAWDLVPEVVANAVFYLVNEKMPLGWGIAISGIRSISPEFAELTGKEAMYFTNPFGLPPEFSVVNESNAQGRIYLGIFVTKNEYDYFCDNGAERFEQIMKSKNVDPYDVLRQSVI